MASNCGESQGEWVRIISSSRASRKAERGVEGDEEGVDEGPAIGSDVPASSWTLPNQRRTGKAEEGAFGKVRLGDWKRGLSRTFETLFKALLLLR